MKKPVLAGLLILALAAFFWNSRQPFYRLFSHAPEAPVRNAFLRSQWGMSPQEVTEANGSILSPAASGKLFHEAESGQEERYKTLEVSTQRFLGREAIVRYTFKDDRLVSYHVFAADSDCEALDQDVRRYLDRDFGSGGSETGEDGSLKKVWQTKEYVVNYWFLEEELTLTKPCRAVFGVMDRSED